MKNINLGGSFEIKLSSTIQAKIISLPPPPPLHLVKCQHFASGVNFELLLLNERVVRKFENCSVELNWYKTYITCLNKNIKILFWNNLVLRDGSTVALWYGICLESGIPSSISGKG